MDLREYVESLRTDGNSHQVDYIFTNWIDRGKSPKQMRTAFIKSVEARQWQAEHGSMQYREANAADAAFFRQVIARIEEE